MARWKFQGTTKDQSGRILPSATISVYLAGTTTPASVYISVTSTTAVNSVTSSSTDATYAFYTDSFDYDHDQTFKIIITKPSYTSVTYDNLPHGEVVLGTYIISTAKTVTTYVKVPKGVVYAKSGSGSLTFNGPFEAGLYQVFSDFSAGDVTGLKESRPEWWAVNTIPGTTDLTTALQSAVTGGKEIILSNSYKHTTTISVPDDRVIKGLSPSVAIHSWGCNGLTITESTIAQGVEIAGFKMLSFSAAGAARPYTHKGIVAIGGPYLTNPLFYRINIHNIYFDGWDEASRFSDVWDSQINKNEFAYNHVGIMLAELTARTNINDNMFTVFGGTATTTACIKTERISYAPEGIRISGNHLYGSAYGVWITSLGTGYTITDNEAASTINAIYSAHNTALIIANNYYLASYGSGGTIHLVDRATPDDYAIVISNNFIINLSTGVGLCIGTRTQGTTVVGNSIRGGSVGTAISTGDTVKHNVIANNTLGGRIALTSDSAFNTIKGNILLSPSTITSPPNMGNIVINNVNVRKLTLENYRESISQYSSGGVPTTGTYNRGDIIINNLAASGQPSGWVCIKSGTFSAASEAGSVAAIDSETITGTADTSDFNVGDYIESTLGNAGYSPFVIKSIVVNTSITVWSPLWTGTGACTITTPDPLFAAMANLP